MNTHYANYRRLEECGVVSASRKQENILLLWKQNLIGLFPGTQPQLLRDVTVYTVLRQTSALPTNGNGEVFYVVLEYFNVTLAHAFPTWIAKHGISDSLSKFFRDCDCSHDEDWIHPLAMLLSFCFTIPIETSCVSNNTQHHKLGCECISTWITTQQVSESNFWLIIPIVFLLPTSAKHMLDMSRKPTYFQTTIAPASRPRHCSVRVHAKLVHQTPVLSHQDRSCRACAVRRLNRAPESENR